MAYGRKADSERDRVGRWFARLDASKVVYQREKPVWDTLEDALAGKFPELLAPKGDGQSQQLGFFRLRSSDQIDMNLLLRGKRYMEEMAFDEFPFLKWSRMPSSDTTVCIESIRLADKILDEGGAVYESKKAMSYSMTRGTWIVWVDVQGPVLTPEELSASTIPPSAFVEQALAGKLVELPYGVDYQAIQKAAEAVLPNPDDPAIGLGLSPEQEDALRALALTCEKEYLKQIHDPHGLRRGGRIVYEATPYGTWCLFDMSVSDHSRKGWVARKLVFTPEEFDASKAFKASAKAYVLEKHAKIEEEAEGHVKGQAQPTGGTNTLIDEQDRIVVWVIYDRVNWKRHYVAEGCGEYFLEEDDRYPYMDPATGKPIFPDFFPCEIRTPIEHNSEEARRLLGMPVLEPGWASQVEFIKLHSSFIGACKKAATQYLANKDEVADEVVKALQRGEHLNVVTYTPTPGATGQRPAFEKVEWGPVPIDFERGLLRCLRDFCRETSIPLLPFTGEAAQDTLGQDQMSMQGAMLVLAGMVRNYESGYAGLAEKGLRLFRAYGTPDEIASYLGPESTQPRSQEDGTTKPSVYEGFRTLSMDGCKLTCRFATNQRGEDAVRIKSAMDFIALNNVTLEPMTQQPWYDPKPLLDQVARMQDIEGLVPNPAIKLMLQMQEAQQQAEAEGDAPPGGEGGGDREAQGGGREDGRKAGGGRGPPGVPGRQDRNEKPQTQQQKSGVQNRAYTAKA